MSARLAVVLLILAAASACASRPKVALTTSVSESELAGATLAAKVKTALLNDPVVGPRRIDVHVTGYEVRLTGRVASAAERDHALRLAAGVEGVRTVKSDLEIRP